MPTGIGASNNWRRSLLTTLKRSSLIALALLLWASLSNGQIICPGKQPCPQGYHETAINCDACVYEGFEITSATDEFACPIGETYCTLGDVKQCCPPNMHIKPDGQCFVTNDEDPCTCIEGWYSVAPFACCPVGKFLSADNPNCCTPTEGANCCMPWQEWRIADSMGVCVPKKPTGVKVR